MRRQRPAVFVSLIIVAAFGASVASAVTGRAWQEKASADESRLVGDWSGESICVGYRPACHDEKVVYRVVRAKDKPGILTITMDKIVDGKPDTMGVFDFKYDAAKGTLVNEFTRGNTHGLWEFTVRGDVMEGTLSILPDKTTGRRVKVKKVP